MQAGEQIMTHVGGQKATNHGTCPFIDLLFLFLLLPSFILFYSFVLFFLVFFLFRFGLTCSGGWVIDIALPNNGLGGTLSRAIADVPYLEKLDLSTNL